MFDTIQRLPGYRIYEYQLIFDLPSEINRKIVEEKKASFRVCHTPLGWRNKPMLSLARFSQLAMMEERLVTRLKTIAMGHQPLLLEFTGYGAYPSHTVFLSVSNHEPLRKLVRSIRENQRLLRHDPASKPYFMQDPHVLMATKLNPVAFEKAWHFFSQRTFRTRCLADSLLLLRRSRGEKSYQILERLELMNLPVSTIQGALFA